ncbi:MAG TPA: membrane protein insertion efficiency factor YidD [Prolixibacteraceae bacterium]|nr:membrane protein insertion efficiency factor YidD [Prolixibacteraceae bacterium]
MQNRLRKSCLLISTLLLFLCASLTKVEAQEQLQYSLKADILLIDVQKCKHHRHNHIRPFIYANQPVKFKTHNPFSLLYGGLLFVYQNTISQHFSADCLYSPSCSEFSKQAVKEFGFIKGGLLSFDRLNRCTRLSALDMHPSVFNPKTHRASDPILKYK